MHFFKEFILTCQKARLLMHIPVLCKTYLAAEMMNSI